MKNRKEFLVAQIIYFILFRFEKMISGMYLGEITRVVCLDLIEKKLLFNGQAGKFSAKNSFPTEFVSDIER